MDHACGESLYFDHLAESSEFNTLHAKLAAVFSRIATGEFASKFLLANERRALQGKLLKGRQIYKMLFDHVRISEAEGAVLDLCDLLDVRVNGDNLEKFWG